MARPDSIDGVIVKRPENAAPDSIVRVFRVPPESAGMRLDVFLQSQLRNTSRTRARTIIEKSAYTPDGRRRRASDRLKAEDRVVLWRPPFDEIDEAAELPVLHEDEHLLVVDKPALMAVHPTARHHHHTVLKLLQAERPEAWFSLIHRLDRETSGILLVAKSPEADRRFKRLLEDRSTEVAQRAVTSRESTNNGAITDDTTAREAGTSVTKTYLAITWGCPDDAVIDLPLEPDTDNPLRVKMRVARAGGLEARTGVEVLERRGGYALVRCRLFTGRQHQIRVHLAAVGTAIVGDKLYGPDETMLARAADNKLTEDDLRQLELPRHALHAHQYGLRHPLTESWLEVTSPLAADLAGFWKNR